MRTTKRIIALLLCLFTVASLAACVSQSTTDFLDKVPEFSTDVESEVESVADPEPSEGQTRMPVVNSVFNTSAHTVAISGTCESGATVKATLATGGSSTVTAKGESFVLELTLGDRSEYMVSLTATAEGKTESMARELTAKPNLNTSGNLVYPTVLADKFVLFSEDSINALSEENIRNNGVAEDFASECQTVLNTLKNAGSTELIYVMAPSRARVLADSLPEGVEAGAVSLYTQTVKVLKDAGVTVIDLSDAFAAAKDYPLFYDTHSGWSDYAAFVAYTELMSYIAQNEKFAAAAPAGKDGFDIKTVEGALLGDLAYHFGLDINAFSETVYDFVPKADLNIGDTWADNEEAPAETPESSEEESTEASSEEASSEESSGEASSEESSEESSEAEGDKIPADIADGLIKISDVKLNLADNDYRFYDSYFYSKLYDVDPDDVLCDSKFGFFTNRKELPSALIYRSADCAPITDMLAERFNNSLFWNVDNYNVVATAGSAYAGTTGNKNVDYIIVLITEDELTKLYD